MLFKKILTNGCVYYTVIITAFYTFGLLAENGSQWIPTLRIAYSLLGFSLCFSALNELLKKRKFGFAPKLFLHFGISALVYFLLFVLGGGFHQNGGSILAAMLVFSAVYALGAVIVLLFRWLFGLGTKETKPKKADEYKSIFDKQ